MSKGVVFTKHEAQRTERTVADSERRTGSLQLREKKVRVRSSGGVEECVTQYAIWFSGRPTGGSTSIPFSVAGDSENVTIGWDYSVDDTRTALATHSRIAYDDTVVTSPGGSLPHQVIRFYFEGITGTYSVVIGNQTDSFTGGSSPYSTIDQCCG